MAAMVAVNTVALYGAVSVTAGRSSKAAGARPAVSKGGARGVPLGFKQCHRGNPLAARGTRSARHNAVKPAIAAITDTTETETEEKEVELKSDVGVDYTKLRDHLAAGEWREADDEHRRLMCVLAGEEAELREWVYFTEVKNFPVVDLETIDNLWTHYSKGNYGFSVQRKIWVGKRKQWGPFFKAIDWTTGENNAYRKWPQDFLYKADAAKGHLPLTNALRGTQLLTALLDHPAFAPPETAEKDGKEEGGIMKGLKGLKKPSWMK